MANRKEDGALTLRFCPAPSKILLSFLSPILCYGALLGCAAPGQPTPPRPVVPQAITDLAARQAGDSVVLTFTLPRHSADGEPLAEPPEVEIYRGWASPSSPPGQVSPQLAYTIPPAVVETYRTEERVTFADALRPGEHAGEQAIYFVRTRASRRRASADSNVVSLLVYPVAEPVADLRAVVAETAVELSWSAPTRTTGGAPISSLAGYRVYRGELEPGAQASAEANPDQAKLRSPLELLGPTPSPGFRDTRFEFGRAYLYTVRSVIQYEAESADSRPVVLKPRDVFPPAAPKDLVAVVIPAAPPEPAHIELSWAISAEIDLAGYYVYRSEPPDAAGQRLTRELLLAPTFRDMSVERDRRYTYQVSAVDRAGNESPLGDPVSVEFPAPRSP